MRSSAAIISLLNLVVAAPLLVAADDTDRQTVLVVVGNEGTAEYGSVFNRSAERWQEACQRANAHFIHIGHVVDESSDREALRKQLELMTDDSPEPLWLVLIGHGTFDGKTAKFNLRGPDVSADELEKWLQPIKRPLAVINCSASSGPFLGRLSATNRVIVTATKSGFEQNYTRFGEYFAAAIGDPAADLDKDEQTSLLEAYLATAAKVAEFYEQAGRLSTEHALLDDNGDSKGTPATWFRGVRATQKAKDGVEPDGRRAGQWCLIRSPFEQTLPAELRARRDLLELQVARLRDRKHTMAEDEYYARLESLLVKLATLYETVAEQPASPNEPKDE